MMIQKYLEPTFKMLAGFNKQKIVFLDTKHYLFKNYEMLIEKSERGFSAKLNFKPFAGLSSSNLERIGFPGTLLFNYEGQQYFIPQKSILLHAKMSSFENDFIEISGRIDQISSINPEKEPDKKYCRHIQQTKGKRNKLNEIGGWYYQLDMEAKDKNLTTLTINDIEYHIFECLIQDRAYLIVDSLASVSISHFKNVVNANLLSLGFFYGTMHLEEGYILSSSSSDFVTIDDITFSVYRKSIETTYRLHTTNAFSISDMSGQTEQEIEDKVHQAQSWLNDAIEIEPETFSAITNLIYFNEPVSRAIMVMLEGNNLSLELKGSAYSIALEAISSVIIKEAGEKKPKPLDSNIFTPIKDKLKAVVDNELAENKQNAAASVILKNRIDNLNSPSNADKLKKAFTLVGYTLQGFEMKALLARDKFQHGDLPVSSEEDDVIFKELYFTCLIMHRLIAVLLLKKVAYKGLIINYLQTHHEMTGKNLGEEIFYRID